MDEDVSLIIIIAFTIYNLFSKRVVEFLGRNLIGIASFTGGLLISGQLYLKLCYYMSDEYYAVKSIPFGIAKWALTVTAIACVISFFITEIRKKIKR